MELPTATILDAFSLHGHIGFEYVPLWGNVLIAIWFWCFGGNVGSFMNVVIYRLPAGVSVVHPGSRCPRCRHAIRWYDNIPVVSWLVLRAKCRDCGLPIAARYPVVEAIIAIWFVAVAFAEPIYLSEHLSRDFTLPLLRAPGFVALWIMFSCHALVICTLFCATLIRHDGHVPPARLYVPAFLVGFALPLIWPGVRLVPFYAPLQMAGWLGALLDGLSGLAVGASLGLLIQRLGVKGRGGVTDAWCVPLALLGLVLGWQAVCAISCLAVGADILFRLAARLRPGLNRWPAVTHLVVFSTVYILLWLPIARFAPWLGPSASIATFAVAVAIIGIESPLLKLVKPASTPSGAPEQYPDEIPGVSDVSNNAKPDLQRILDSPSYLPAELDSDFLRRYETRPVRVQLELLKPEMGLAEHEVHSTIVAFGGTQIVEETEARTRLEMARSALEEAPDDAQRQRAMQRAERILAKSKYYDAAREFGRLVSSTCQIKGRCEYVIITGGGPGIMEAANRGAYEVGAKSIGLNITLPEEQVPNPYISPELCFQFHYFALRKMHFLLRAKALVVFPGGFGTLDELFDALTLRQTKRMQEIPIILFGRAYWERVIDFPFLADEGVIADEHLDLIDFVETPQEAWDVITKFHQMMT
jgi:uncharacterized protein (TIGR00730 family)